MHVKCHAKIIVVNESSFLLCFSTGMCHKCGQLLHDFVSLFPGVLEGVVADKVT